MATRVIIALVLVCSIWAHNPWTWRIFEVTVEIATVISTGLSHV